MEKPRDDQQPATQTRGFRLLDPARKHHLASTVEAVVPGPTDGISRRSLAEQYRLVTGHGAACVHLLHVCPGIAPTQLV